MREGKNMKCRSCEKDLKEGAKFCQYCGAKSIENGEVKQEVPTQQPIQQPKAVSIFDNKKNKMIIAIVAAILVVAGAFYALWTPVINVEEFVQITFDGVDTKGRARVLLDEDALGRAVYKKLGGKIEIDSEDFDLENVWDSAVSELKIWDAVYKIVNSVEVELDKYEDLSNGDKVTVTITIDEKELKNHKIRLRDKGKTENVEGLKEATALTAEILFDESNLEVVFVGVAPNAEVELRNISKDSFISQIYYSADKTSGLAVGDTITVTAEVDEYYAEDAGYMVSGELTREFTAEDLDHYITALEDIDDTTMEKVEKQSLDIVEEWMANRDSRYSHSEPEEIAKLFRTLKPGASDNNGWYVSVENALYVVYVVTETKAADSWGYGAEGPEELYIGVMYTNIIGRDDGSIDVVLTDGQLVESSYYSMHKSYDDFYRDTMTANKANYNLEEF